MSATKPSARNERIKSLRITEGMMFHLAAFADENSMSISEAIREMITEYAEGTVDPVKQEPNHKRVTVWIDPPVWEKFRLRALKDKITQTEAIDAAMRKLL